MYRDSREALDSINRVILIRKASHASVVAWTQLPATSEIVTLSWNSTIVFLNRRRFASAVPRGSRLFSLAVFINDAWKFFRHGRFLLSADDLKVYNSVESLIVAWYIRSDLFRLHEWSVENTLPFNISKCHVTRFTRKKSSTWFHLLRINDTPLDKRETTTDLGIALSFSLSSVVLRIYYSTSMIYPLNLLMLITRYYTLATLRCI